MTVGVDTHLPQVCCQCRIIPGFAGGGAVTNDDAVFQGCRKADFDAELVRLVGFTFGDAFDFRGVNGAEHVLVFGITGQDTAHSL